MKKREELFLSPRARHSRAIVVIDFRGRDAARRFALSSREFSAARRLFVASRRFASRPRAIDSRAGSCPSSHLRAPILLSRSLASSPRGYLLRVFLVLRLPPFFLILPSASVILSKRPPSAALERAFGGGLGVEPSGVSRSCARRSEEGTRRECVRVRT